MRLDGAVALVTGASSGIGAATAGALAAAGATLLLSGRDEARLAGVARRTGGVPLGCDLAAAGAPARLAEAALARAAETAAGRGIDVLVNNAGLGWAGPLGGITPAKVTELATVNLTAPMELTRLLLPGMLERGRGGVVFVSSIAGVTGVRGEAVYAATKAGLGAFAESLAYETRGRGVGVSVIVPGVIDTPFFGRRGTPYDRRRPAPQPAERVAAAIVSALEHERAVVYVPRWMRVPAWLHGAAPGLFRTLAARFG
jgi:short-subunit dehydrogenase